MTTTDDDGSPLKLLEDRHQDGLLAHSYQHLVRDTEVTVRHAVRLERAPCGGDGEDLHPLARTLASDAGRKVLDGLLEREAARSAEIALQAHGSLAAAYVRLLRHFDNRMDAAAEHLRISVSRAYRRCVRTRCLAAQPQHIPVPATRSVIKVQKAEPQDAIAAGAAMAAATASARRWVSNFISQNR